MQDDREDGIQVTVGSEQILELLSGQRVLQEQVGKIAEEVRAIHGLQEQANGELSKVDERSIERDHQLALQIEELKQQMSFRNRVLTGFATLLAMLAAWIGAKD